MAGLDAHDLGARARAAHLDGAALDAHLDPRAALRLLVRDREPRADDPHLDAARRDDDDRPGRCVTSQAMRPRASTSFSADGVLSPTSTRDRGSTFRLEPSVNVTDSASAAVSSCAPSHADATVPCVPGSIARARTTTITATAVHTAAVAHTQPRPGIGTPSRADTRPHSRSTRASDRSTRT